jgi:hypothetical protein
LQEGRPLQDSASQKDEAKIKDYENLLSFICGQKSVTIPDPMELNLGWIKEEVRFSGACLYDMCT